VKARDRVVRVVLPGKQVRELEVIEFLLERLELGAELLGQFWIVLRREQLVGDLDVVEQLGQSGVSLDGFVEPFELGVQPLAASWVLPDAGLGELALEFLYAGSLAFDVKGTPWRS